MHIFIYEFTYIVIIHNVLYMEHCAQCSSIVLIWVHCSTTCGSSRTPPGSQLHSGYVVFAAIDPSVPVTCGPTYLKP